MKTFTADCRVFRLQNAIPVECGTPNIYNADHAYQISGTSLARKRWREGNTTTVSNESTEEIPHKKWRREVCL